MSVHGNRGVSRQFESVCRESEVGLQSGEEGLLDQAGF